MNKERKILDRHGELVRVGDIVQWEQESGNKLLVQRGEILSIDDSIHLRTSKGDHVELMWPYDLPDAQIEKISSLRKNQ